MNSSSTRGIKNHRNHTQNSKGNGQAATSINQRKAVMRIRTQQNIINKKLLPNDRMKDQSQVNMQITQPLIHSERRRQLTCITQRSSIATNKNLLTQHNLTKMANKRIMKTLDIEKDNKNIYSSNIFGGKIQKSMTSFKVSAQNTSLNPTIDFNLNLQQIQQKLDKSGLYRQNLKRYLTQFQPQTLITHTSNSDSIKKIIAKIKVEDDGFAHKRPHNSQLKRLQARNKKSMIHSNSTSLKKIALKQLKAVRQSNKKVIRIVQDHQSQTKKIYHQMQQRIITSEVQQYIPNNKFGSSFKKSLKKLSPKKQMISRQKKSVSILKVNQMKKRMLKSNEGFKKYRVLQAMHIQQ